MTAYAKCDKCGFGFRGLGLKGSPWINKYTGQWICYTCRNKLPLPDQTKYELL